MSDEYVREIDSVSISESEASYETQGSTSSESRPNQVDYSIVAEKRSNNIQECGDQTPRFFISSAILLRARRRNVRPRQECRVHDALPVQESWREITPRRRQATEN